MPKLSRGKTRKEYSTSSNRNGILRDEHVPRPPRLIRERGTRVPKLQLSKHAGSFSTVTYDITCTCYTKADRCCRRNKPVDALTGLLSGAGNSSCTGFNYSGRYNRLGLTELVHFSNHLQGTPMRACGATRGMIVQTGMRAEYTLGLTLQEYEGRRQKYPMYPLGFN